ncbi:MAG: DnaJ domain-containing protein [Desulfococcaceae bacterium]
MPRKDYYAILGITPETSADDIRAAFRRLAKRYHPDGNEDGDDARFRDVAEAYQVLSDPDKRRRYHRDGGTGGSEAGTHRTRARNVRSFSGAFGGKRGKAESPLEQMMRNMFRARMATGGGSLVELEVVLDPGEARNGVAAKLEVALDKVCEACGGRGNDGFVSCGHCGGRGLRRSVELVGVRFPAGVQDRSVFEVPLIRDRRPAGTLRLYVRVGGE